MDSSDLESLRAGMERLAEAARGAAEALAEAAVKLAEIVGILTAEAAESLETALMDRQAMEDTAAEKIEERHKNGQRFQQCERAENARRAARFKQYNRAAVIVKKRTRPRSREFKPP